MRVDMTTRETLVGEIRDRLLRSDCPRLTISIILALAGGVAFLTSFAMLAIGLDWMGPRYALASIVGYLAFVGLIRGWITMRRREWTGPEGGDLPNPFDFADADIAAGTARGAGHAAGRAFAGGHSGGGGGGSSWMPTPEPVEQVTSTSAREASSAVKEAGKGWDFSIDFDEGAIFLVLAIVAALSGLFCIVYVVYIAPLLLAEIALDAALVSAAYHRLRKEDVEHWTGAVLRRTLVPATLLVLFMFVAGFAAQQYAPEAHSIGGVVRALVS
jgi:hypothetical protein